MRSETTDPETPDRPLRGLARTIDALFRREAGSAEPVEVTGTGGEGSDGDVAWVTEAGVRLPGDVHTVDPLLKAVRAWVRAGEDEADAVREALLDAVEDARGRRAGMAMADAVEVLARLPDRQPESREIALSMVTPGVASVLVQRVQDAPDEDRRAELVELLPALGQEVEVAVLDALREEALDRDADRTARRALLRVVSLLAGRGSSILAEMVDDSNWRVARNAVQLVGDVGGDDAIQHLTVALGNEDARVRREVLNALAKLGGEDAGYLAVGKLEDPDPSVRAQAARTVGLIQAERGLRALLALLESEDDEAVVLEAVRALGLLGDPSAVIPLEKRATPSLFGRAPTEIRVAAYRALAAIGTPHATSLIQDAAEDRDPQVRRTIQAILRSRDEA